MLIILALSGHNLPIATKSMSWPKRVPLRDTGHHINITTGWAAQPGLP
ncbi:hypothetical protein [Vibrio sp. HI00D65]|nr:hypothetical protein [Vibrio sp. HI00D65]